VADPLEPIAVGEPQNHLGPPAIFRADLAATRATVQLVPFSRSPTIPAREFMALQPKVRD